MDLLKNLNPEQLKAVLHKDGPLLIVAGAGTGKTTAITQRVAYLIEQGRAKSDEILALTFTEKAAGEMADRVGALLPYGYFDLWISTFHGFAERILKDHGLDIGLPGDFKLLNEFEQWALIKKNLDKFNLDYYRPLGNPTKFIRVLIKHFSRAKDEDVSPAAYLEYADGLKQDLDAMLNGGAKNSKPQIPISKKTPNSNIQKNKKIGHWPLGLGHSGNDDKNEINDKINEQEVRRLNEIANAYHVYQQLLLDNNFLDFGDLINYALKLFRERPAILEKYRKQFKYILVDEFQDTNWAQYELIKLLSGPKGNLAVVGDDDQSIYKFRGASLSNILQFAKDYPGAETIFLVKNYRSEQNILDLAYEFIRQNNPNRLEYQLTNPKSQIPMSKKTPNPNIQKLNKKLVAENKGVGVIQVLRGIDLAEEVKLTADKIIELKNTDKAAGWNDFAVLVRANDSARDFMAEFDRRGLPYIFGAARGLYFKPLILDVIAYFKLLDNYHESAAMYRILNLPVFNFTYEELVNFNHLANKKAWSLYEVLNNGSALKFGADLEKKIKPVLALISKHSALAREKSASEVFLAFMNDSGYLKYLTKEPPQKSLAGLSLLNQFLKRSQAFESAADDKSVKAFLEELNLEMEAGEEGGLAPDLEAGPEAIKILTAHGAKGLEFKYVFIANLVDKRFPTIERHEAIDLPDALVKEILPQGDIHLEEERRLFYVAMTRARHGLYFTWAADYGGAREKKPSRFLMEMGMAEKEKKVINKKEAFIQLPTKNQESGIRNQAAEKKFLIPNSSFLPPNHFSYSQLAAYSNCPYQYRFAHILKIPAMGKEQFSFGKTLHATLQKLFVLLNEKKGLGQGDLFARKTLPASLDKGGGVAFEEILKLYEQSWIDDWYKDKKHKQARKKQGQEILKVFYDKHKDNWPEALFLEKGFNLKISHDKNIYIIRGVIDRIDKAPSAGSGQAGIKLVDYKTGKPKSELKFEEKEQLLIYQLAVSELFKEEVKALSFYYLDDNTEIEFIGKPAELEKVKAKIINTINEIRQGKFPAKPKSDKICEFCDFKGICEFKK